MQKNRVKFKKNLIGTRRRNKQRGRLAHILITKDEPQVRTAIRKLLEKEGIEFIKELTLEYAGVKIIAISGGGRTDPFDYLDPAKKFGAGRTFKKPFVLPRPNFGEVKNTSPNRNENIRGATPNDYCPQRRF